MFLNIIVVIFINRISTAEPMSVIKNPLNFGKESINELTKYISTIAKFTNTNEIKEPKIKSASLMIFELSDEDLIKLLTEQPHKTEYDQNDLFQVAMKNVDKNIDSIAEYSKFQKEAPQKGYLNLEKQQVSPSAESTAEFNTNASERINFLLQDRVSTPELEHSTEDDMDDPKREKLFDLLVVQLKSLCCKSNKNKRFKIVHDKPFVKKAERLSELPNEHMFLILNDEVNTNSTDEIISVDPDSLQKNSSVLLLGPIKSPLSDSQLKVVINRISNELNKPDYVSILNQLASGQFTDNNNHFKLVKHLVAGPQTRRYIKPHRCNHQSMITRVYGGPKWLICTGYLNLNTPSIYD